MRTKKHLAAFLFLLSFLLFACDNDSVLVEIPDPLPGGQYYDIEAIRGANRTEQAITAQFIERKMMAGGLYHKAQDSEYETRTVKYTGLEGKSLVTTFTTGTEKGQDAYALILIADEEDHVQTYYEHVTQCHGTTRTVTVMHEGVEWFVSTVDAATEEILDFSFGKNLPAGVYDKDRDGEENEEEGGGNTMTFAQCATMAIDACLNDGSCAFICAITWKYCLGAIALACLIVTL